jgi:hypothetical protein
LTRAIGIGASIPSPKRQFYGVISGSNGRVVILGTAFARLLFFLGKQVLIFKVMAGATTVLVKGVR